MKNPCLSTQKALVTTASMMQGFPGYPSEKKIVLSLVLSHGLMSETALPEKMNE